MSVIMSLFRGNDSLACPTKIENSGGQGGGGFRLQESPKWQLPTNTKRNAADANAVLFSLLAHCPKEREESSSLAPPFRSDLWSEPTTHAIQLDMAPTPSIYSPHRRKRGPVELSNAFIPTAASLRASPLRTLVIAGAALMCAAWIINSVHFLQDISVQSAFKDEIQQPNRPPVAPPTDFHNKPPVMAMDTAPARKELSIDHVAAKPRTVSVTPTRESWPMQSEFYTSSFAQTDTSTTIIFNLFKGPAEALKLQLLAATSQRDVAPPEIWVMCFDSPMQSEYEAVVKDFRKTSNTKSKIVLTVSDFNHKFHGRFLLAYMATTKYVLIIDDDKNIDETTVKDYISYMNRQKGVWGNTGHVRAVDFNGYKAWPKHFDSDYSEVDYLSGMWFLEQSWLEYFVKERMPSWATSEDMHLSHVMRKYLNLNTYGGKVALSPRGLPGKKYAATTGKALDLREYIFDHQLGRGNKVAAVDQPIDTVVYAETVEDIDDFIGKLDACGPTPSLRDAKATIRPPWCEAGRTAAVFRGAKEQDVVGLIHAATRLCAKTKCEYLSVKPKIKHPIRYFNMREGYGQDSVEIPWQTGASDVLTSFVGVLNNLLPSQIFVPDVANAQWVETNRNGVPGKRDRLEIYHDAIRLAVKIHGASPTNQKWQPRELKQSQSTAYPTEVKAFTWKYSTEDLTDEASWQQLVRPLV